MKEKFIAVKETGFKQRASNSIVTEIMRNDERKKNQPTKKKKNKQNLQNQNPEGKKTPLFLGAMT